ncbi:hypothetical protein JW906_06425 [bacterium]|nr:hypothetical protein [bacterium]
MKIKILAVLLTAAGLAAWSGCARKAKDPVLARVGDRTITVGEYIRRAEYTIRPPYAKLNTPVQRSIVLNSLIAEKLFALEGEKDSRLLQNERFGLEMKGRLEQAMRFYMYQHEALDRADVDKADVERTAALAGRTYELAYFSIPDSSAAAVIGEQLKSGVPFEEVFRSVADTMKMPVREASYLDEKHRAVRDALFSGPLARGQVLDPVNVDGEYTLFMQVRGWTDRPIITDGELRRRYEDVREEMVRERAIGIWEDRVGRIMEDKTLHFYTDAFVQLVKLVGDQYYKNLDEIKDSFNRAFWSDRDMEVNVALPGNASLRQAPFFRIQDKVWTIADFERLMLSHPLVFRDTRIPKSEFADQFRLAVGDLMRDHFINEEAYKRGYDRIPAVQNQRLMFQDAMVAVEHRQRILESMGETRDLSKHMDAVLNQRLNPYVDSLQAVYSGKIGINVEELEKLQLTRIDLFVKYKQAPYPVVVPDFPILTSDYRLDYGKKMK